MQLCGNRLPFYSTVVLLLSVISAPAQNKLKSIDASAATPQTEVLVLGSYHMDNPGLDLHNTKADDVLAPKRQAEIEELTAVLARFRPTKIAVEWDAGSQARLDRAF